MLFDNQTDPCQMTNLVGQPQAAGLQAEMEAMLARKLKQARDEFLPADTYIKRWGYSVDPTGTIPYTE